MTETPFNRRDFLKAGAGGLTVAGVASQTGAEGVQNESVCRVRNYY